MLATLHNAPRVFISYAKEEVGIAAEVRRLLTLADFDPWMDSSGLLAGDAWQPRLADAIHTSDFIVALVSQYAAGGYQETELRIAAECTPDGRPADAPFVVPCIVGRLFRESLEAMIPPFLDIEATIMMPGLQSHWRYLHQALCTAVPLLGGSAPPLLRSTSRMDVDEAVATQMIVQRNFFDSSRHAAGRAAADMLHTFWNGAVVRDDATGREWIRRPIGTVSGHGEGDVHRTVAAFNAQEVLGENDWRLPTLEEAMSIMAPEKNYSRLFVAPSITEGDYLLTCDTELTGRRAMAWIASYIHGDCQQVPVDAPVPVRLVRTFWPHLQ